MMSICGKFCNTNIAAVFKSLTLLAGVVAPSHDVQAQRAFPVATPGQVAASVEDCLKSGGSPDQLAKMNWYPEPMPLSPSGMHKYVNHTTPAWLTLPNKAGGEELCWVIARATDERLQYVQAVSEVVGTRATVGPKDSEWRTKSHVFVMDWFSEQGITGMRIEVHRFRR